MKSKLSRSRSEKLNHHTQSNIPITVAYQMIRLTSLQATSYFRTVKPQIFTSILSNQKIWASDISFQDIMHAYLPGSHVSVLLEIYFSLDITYRHVLIN